MNRRLIISSTINACLVHFKKTKNPYQFGLIELIENAINQGLDHNQVDEIVYEFIQRLDDNLVDEKDIKKLKQIYLLIWILLYLKDDKEEE